METFWISNTILMVLSDVNSFQRLACFSCQAIIDKDHLFRDLT